MHGEPKPWATKTAHRGISGYEWERRRQAVIERDGGLCQLRLEGCTEIATTADHIVPMALGGTEDLGNLRASCGACNERRRAEQSRASRGEGGRNFRRLGAADPLCYPSPNAYGFSGDFEGA
ncbi:MAG: HNH endonuclease [Dehalococcoidia bacterium]